jgi:arsenate reductase
MEEKGTRARILILCTGNSSRSQMAQGFLQSLDRNLEVESAGTNPASQVSSKAIKVMQEEGIDISRNVPKSVDLFLNDSWDFVITVCDEANEVCPFFPGLVKNRLHMSFEDPSKIKGTEELILREYRRIRDEIKNRFREFYQGRILLNEKK